MKIVYIVQESGLDCDCECYCSLRGIYSSLEMANVARDHFCDVYSLELRDGTTRYQKDVTIEVSEWVMDTYSQPHPVYMG